MTAFLEKGDERATKIATSEDSIETITKNYFRVKSESGNGWHNVKKMPDADVWICDCRGFMSRLSKNGDKRCIHIKKCQILQNLANTDIQIEQIERPKMCPKCSSTTIIKIGFRLVKSGIKKRRYQCKQCKRKFTIYENGFGKLSSDPRIVCEALNLKFSGLSFRDIERHIFVTHNIKLSHVSILNWFKKYPQIMKEYVDNLIPEASQVWSVDEMMLNVKDTKPIEGKGLYVWMWSIIDPQTKFVIASEISKRREIGDARTILASGKEKTKSSPSFVITDALHSYDQAFRKEFNVRKTAHIKTKSLSDGFANRPIERYHNEVRSVIKSKRGLGNDKSAQEFADANRIYHNYIRPHSGLPDKKTPAEAAGLDLNLGKNKIHDLIVKSATPNNFATQLGLRINRVVIMNEKDSIKVIAKGWIEKQTWREINDILRINGFSWLPNGRDSCWLKLLPEAQNEESEET